MFACFNCALMYAYMYTNIYIKFSRVCTFTRCVYMCVYIHTYLVLAALTISRSVHTITHIHLCMHRYVHVYKYTCMHVYNCMLMYVYIYVSSSRCTDTLLICACIHTHLQICIYRYSHVYKYTCMHV